MILHMRSGWIHLLTIISFFSGTEWTVNSLDVQQNIYSSFDIQLMNVLLL